MEILSTGLKRTTWNLFETVFSKADIMLNTIIKIQSSSWFYSSITSWLIAFACAAYNHHGRRCKVYRDVVLLFARRKR